MSKRMSISPAAMAVLAGCGVTATTEYPAADQAVLTAMATGPTGEDRVGVTCSSNPPNSACVVGGCPDPKTDCTHPNGPGIFFEERGSAGINAPGENVMMMITAFTNKAAVPLQGSSVTFRGRYTDPFADPKQYPSGLWLWTDGTIDSADYKTALGPLQVGLQVVKVSEKNTLPTWTLVPKGSSTPIPVSGESLRGLTLHVTFTVVSPALTPVHVLLDFSQSEEIDDTGFPLHAYNLRWRPDGDPPSSATQYCYRGPKNPGGDQVVFQQGISVDPVNGIVTPDPNVVTMSCAWGAVAKVYNWGYPYAPQDGSVPFFYQAAIHMKRAAYCGNFDYHTIDGLSIGILDNNLPMPINTPPLDFVLEARWSPEGATCLTLANRRYLVSPFDGQCPNKLKLKDCSSSAGPAPLESYANRTTQGLPGL